jgi:hypothetical protein
MCPRPTMLNHTRAFAITPVTHHTTVACARNTSTYLYYSTHPPRPFIDAAYAAVAVHLPLLYCSSWCHPPGLAGTPPGMVAVAQDAAHTSRAQA